MSAKAIFWPGYTAALLKSSLGVAAALPNTTQLGRNPPSQEKVKQTRTDVVREVLFRGGVQFNLQKSLYQPVYTVKEKVTGMNGVCGNAKLGSRGDGSRRLGASREFWRGEAQHWDLLGTSCRDRSSCRGREMALRDAQSQDLAVLWDHCQLPQLLLPFPPAAPPQQGTALRTITEVAPGDPFLRALPKVLCGSLELWQ